MKPRAFAAAILLLLLGPIPCTMGGDAAQASGEFDPLRASLPRSEPQPVYAADPDDVWNQVFFLLFTRTVASRVAAKDATDFAVISDAPGPPPRRVTRIESGDRAIDPLYPSLLGINSPSFDFDRDSSWRVLQEPRYSRLTTALEEVQRTAQSRPPLARALMQADLWSAYDMLHQLTGFTRVATGSGAEAVERARVLLPRLAGAMRALALSVDEIAQLPDTYSAAAKALGLPDLLGEDTARRNPDWMEIRWLQIRSHDRAAGYRRVTRVFLRPAERPGDVGMFLRGLHERSAAVDSAALLIQLLLVASDGTVVSSPITYEAQFRGTAARAASGEMPQYQLSRRQLLSTPASGGLVGFDANAVSYLPAAGNDFGFATPPRLTGEAVVAPVGVRCALCHHGTGVGRLMTFAMHPPPGQRPPVEHLMVAENVHGREVVRRKVEREDFRSLKSQWQSSPRPASSRGSSDSIRSSTPSWSRAAASRSSPAGVCSSR